VASEIDHLRLGKTKSSRRRLKKTWGGGGGGGVWF
jgi:hypothetical protein